jgi:Zn-dependent protease
LTTHQEIVFILVLIPSVILHEIMHGVVALAFGDDTAKRAGRLTLNPIPHIDLFGTIILPTLLILIGATPFGWAKPVPVNVSRLRSPRNDGLLVSLAGPATNLVLVTVATVAYRVFHPHGDVAEVLLFLGFANVILAVFNMIPIPPLDGSSLIERVLPERFWPGYLKFRGRAMGLLLVLMLAVPSLFGHVLQPALDLWDRILRA